MVIAKVTKVTVLTEVVLVMEFQREKELVMGTPNKLDELVVLSEDAGLVKIILFLARMCLVEMVPKVEVIRGYPGSKYCKTRIAYKNYIVFCLYSFSSWSKEV